MNIERDKFMAEFLGISVEHYLMLDKWVRFGLVWEHARNQDWWEQFIISDQTQNLVWIKLELIDYEYFTSAIFKFLMDGQ